MDRLRAMEVFVAVCEAGSFAAAAARLRISPPAATRAVAALEDRLGVRLLNRTTRRLALTEEGSRFLESARRLLGDLDEAELAVAGEAAMPRGHLTVSASVAFGRTWGTALMAAFLAAQPRVTASLLLLDRVVDLVEEGVDVGVRIGALPDSTLMARKVGTARRLLVASPDYLARRGAPQRPEELRLHSVIAFTGLMPGREWRHVVDGRPASVTLAPRLEVNDAAAALEAAEHGQGVTLALSYMVAGALAEGRLMPVLASFAPPPVPVRLVWAQRRHLAPKIRAFIDLATPWLRRRLENGQAVGPGRAAGQQRAGG